MHVTTPPLTEPDAVRARCHGVVWRGGVGLLVLAALGGVAHHASRSADATRRVAHWSVALDQARAADLELLPGVGPTLARRMSQVCAEPEPIQAVDLMRVPRLGPTGRRRVLPWVVFEVSALPVQVALSEHAASSAGPETSARIAAAR